MRNVERQEIVQRGCHYCLFYQLKKYKGIKRLVCIYDECPYHELDGFSTYRKYLKSKGDLIFLRRKVE